MDASRKTALTVAKTERKTNDSQFSTSTGKMAGRAGLPYAMALGGASMHFGKRHYSSGHNGDDDDDDDDYQWWWWLTMMKISDDTRTLLFVQTNHRFSLTVYNDECRTVFVFIFVLSVLEGWLWPDREDDLPNDDDDDDGELTIHSSTENTLFVQWHWRMQERLFVFVFCSVLEGRVRWDRYSVLRRLW